jgi:sugar phosphate isomerase/epimerase
MKASEAFAITIKDKDILFDAIKAAARLGFNGIDISPHRHKEALGDTCRGRLYILAHGHKKELEELGYVFEVNGEEEKLSWFKE